MGVLGKVFKGPIQSIWFGNNEYEYEGNLACRYLLLISSTVHNAAAMINDSTPLQNLVSERKELTNELHLRPYSVHLYLRRAQCHRELSYSDLAVGDAYRALLLTDDILDESGEYHEHSMQALLQDENLGGNDMQNNDQSGLTGYERGAVEIQSHNDRKDRFNNGRDDDDSRHILLSISNLVRRQRLKCFLLLGDELLKCGCLKSAYDFVNRGLEVQRGHPELLNLRRQIIQCHSKSLLEADSESSDWSSVDMNDLSDQGYARRELYPWNDFEPDRFSDTSLQWLNSTMKRLAPKCEVRVTSLPVLQRTSTESEGTLTTVKQLGVFATEDLAPEETVLQESSILTANNRLHDPLCDACSAALPPLSESQPPLPTCADCDDIFFCSPACHSAALSLYHPAVCGNLEAETIAKDPSPLAATNALYLRLLGRVYALSQTQGVHPLELPETKYIWGDFFSTDLDSKELPFTFQDNVFAPIHLLEKMGVDIFSTLPTTDTWVTQTLFAKFRGVASARMDPVTRLPNVCAVHPMWCLVNHSCAPNVKWDWAGGDMSLKARGAEDVVKWGGVDEEKRRGGIKKGDEILNHYCDIDLEVEERREWAIGALGGLCVCERCVWEGKQRN